MNNDTPEHVQDWLESVPVLAELANTTQHEQMQSLIGHEGFKLFLGLMLGTRQAFYAQLSAIPLSGSENAARASVIQGQIKGIDLFRQTMLEAFEPVGNRSQS